MKKLTLDEVIDRLTLFDDALMSMVFDGNNRAAELFLRIVLEREDITVNRVVGQRELENPLVEGRGIRLDIWAEDSTGRQFDIEVQRETGGAHFRRARFNSSMLDVRMLEKGQRFQDLRDSYVIFLTEQDIVGAGKPLYHMERRILETAETMGDGSHIIYVNGQYQGDDPVGRLVHDFKCERSSDMFYRDFSEGMAHFKETEGGRRIMCPLIEEYGRQMAAEERKAREAAERRLQDAERKVQDADRKAQDADRKAQDADRKAQDAKREALEARQKEKETFAKKLLSLGGFELDTIAALTGLSPERVRQLQAN